MFRYFYLLIRWGYSLSPPVWKCVSVLVIALLGIVYLGASEQSFRIVGMALQLCGICTVAWELHEIRKLFRLPHPWAVFLDRLMNPPQWKPKPTTLGNLQTGTNPRMAKIILKAFTVDSAAPLGERLTAIEKYIAVVESDLQRLQGQLDQEKQEIRSELHDEERHRQNSDQSINSKLEAAQTGGLNISLVGLIWLSIGLILGSCSLEFGKKIPTEAQQRPAHELIPRVAIHQPVIAKALEEYLLLPVHMQSP